MARAMVMPRRGVTEEEPMSLITRSSRTPSRMMPSPWRWPSMWSMPDLNDRFLDMESQWGEGAAIHVEEFAEDGTFVIRAELPGIDPDRDVEITVVDDQMRLRAERRLEEREEQRQGYRSEFHYGSFRRSITLPVGAKADEVKASYKDGILEVRIPMGQPSAPGQRVTISRD
jgi:HSP20 family protein